MIKLLAQRDPRWASQRLGNGSVTIGSDGCVITCLAMALDMTPPEINSLLLEERVFDGSKVYISLIPYDRVFDGRLRHVMQSQWFDAAVPKLELDKLRAHLRGGDPAIVCVDSTPAMVGVQYHYMLAVDVADDGEIIVNDPWYAVTAPVGDINRAHWKEVFTRFTRIRWGGVYGNNSAAAIYRINYLRRNI